MISNHIFAQKLIKVPTFHLQSKHFSKRQKNQEINDKDKKQIREGNRENS